MTNTRPLRCSFFMDPWEDRWLPGNLERDWWELMGSECLDKWWGSMFSGWVYIWKDIRVISDGVFEKFSFVSTGGKVVFFFLSLGVVLLFWVLQLNERNLGMLCACVLCKISKIKGKLWVPKPLLLSGIWMKGLVLTFRYIKCKCSLFSFKRYQDQDT